MNSLFKLASLLVLALAAAACQSQPEAPTSLELEQPTVRYYVIADT